MLEMENQVNCIALWDTIFPYCILLFLVNIAGLPDHVLCIQHICILYTFVYIFAHYTYSSDSKSSQSFTVIFLVQREKHNAVSKR